MKLIRYGEAGKEKPGVIIDDKYFDLSLYVKEYDEDFFEHGGIARLKKIIADNKLPEISMHERLGSPVARPSKIVCVGLNYAKHAKETNATIPLEPILFLKSTTAIVGPNDNIIIPKDSIKTDWEVELAVVIGKWMEQHGETIYGTRGGVAKEQGWGVVTAKEKTWYVHIITKPAQGYIFIPDVKVKITKAILFANKVELKFKQQPEGVFIYLDGIQVGAVDTIIELQLK